MHDDTFTEALRRQREQFADRYAANPRLERMQREMDAMFGEPQREDQDHD